MRNLQSVLILVICSGLICPTIAFPHAASIGNPLTASNSLASEFSDIAVLNRTGQAASPELQSYANATLVYYNQSEKPDSSIENNYNAIQLPDNRNSLSWVGINLLCIVSAMGKLVIKKSSSPFAV
jgi:hypothetical protein